MIVRFAPSRRAIRPCSTPPKYATNWITSTVMIRTSLLNCSSSWPYCAATPTTVVIPSVNTRYAPRNASVSGNAFAATTVCRSSVNPARSTDFPGATSTGV